MSGQLKRLAVQASIYVAVVAVIWVGATVFAKKVSTHKVLKPREGVECVVVSRAFNTSVACYAVPDGGVG